METALTFASLVSFFALVLTWATLPQGESQAEVKPSVRLADATH